MKPAIIKKNPEKISDIAINDDKSGPKSKYVINDSGGKGNLLMPCMMKAIPSPNRRSN